MWLLQRTFLFDLIFLINQFPFLDTRTHRGFVATKQEEECLVDQLFYPSKKPSKMENFFNYTLSGLVAMVSVVVMFASVVGIYRRKTSSSSKQESNPSKPLEH